MSRPLRYCALILLIAIGVLASTCGGFAPLNNKAPGCAAYIPSDMPLVAHAGGGLPHATYLNNRAALDLAVEHKFELIELDFTDIDGRLAIKHEGHPESDLRLPDLMRWLEGNPQVRIVTDVKTDNIDGLTKIKEAAGALQYRFIPQIYAPAQYRQVASLGYPEQILTIYNLPPDDLSWIAQANGLPLFAVTMPVARADLADQVDHFVYLHTVNEPITGYGLYTDCLIPVSPARNTATGKVSGRDAV